MKVIVCGGRDYFDREHLEETLDLFHARFPITHLIHGAAKGADTLAKQWAEKNKIKDITAMPADLNTHGKRAGYIRNSAMADLGPDLVICFPGGKGTMMMKGIAIERGIEVLDHYDIM